MKQNPEIPLGLHFGSKKTGKISIVLGDYREILSFFEPKQSHKRRLRREKKNTKIPQSINQLRTRRPSSNPAYTRGSSEDGC